NEWAFIKREDEDLSEKYANKALKLSGKNGYEKGEGDACVRLGIIAKNRGQYQLAEEYYLKALDIRQKLPEIGPTVSMYNNLGKLFLTAGEYSKALEYYQFGLSLADETVKNGDDLKILNGIATCYLYLGEYQKALEYNNRDIELREKRGDRQGIANALLTAGTAHRRLNNFSSAEAKYKEGLSIFESLENPTGIAQVYINLGDLYHAKNEFRKELNSYQKALNLKEVLSEDGLALLYRNIGACYKELEKPDSALFYYNKSRELYQSAENALGLAYIEFSFGSLNSDGNHHQKALKHFTESLNILQSNQLSNPFLETNLFDRLSDTYTQLGDYAAALEYRNRHTSLQDSLYTLSMNAANYKYSYEEERRKNEEERRKNDQIINDAKFEKMQLFYTLSGIIALLLFGAGFAFMIFRHRQRKAAMDREIDNLLRNQEVTTAYARIEGQDEERRRIAQDLHDGLGSMLSTVKLYFSAIDAKIGLMHLESREQYGKANQLLDEACEEVRRVAHEMHAGTLKKFGLKAQLEDLAETINSSTRVKVELVTHKLDGRLDTQLEVNIYRIIQELTSNVLKHAKASKLSIELNLFEKIIHILVEDNGVGFKESAAMEKGGLGLSGINKRVNALNGKVDIDSVAGRGTSVSIDIPYQPAAALTENH
ncbi:MAG: sensor histidine kinase, partial [Phaeodactylibacter sp.]|nr:sensor histidine kinase [Phaeodactylibacter sp.]